MESTLQNVGQRAKTQVTKYRWALGLSGLASVIFGIVVIVWPGISLYSLVIVFGAFALARGVLGLIAAISSPIKQGRGWLVLSSLAGIAVGVLVFARTDMSALALLYVIGAYAFALGFLAIVGAFDLPLDTGDSVALGLTGVISILFGVVIFAKPEDGALALLALIAAYALILGVTEIVVAIGGKRIVESRLKQYVKLPEPPKASTT
jgi:uncharacterized membrane protein HdeD (DUF308 family)